MRKELGAGEGDCNLGLCFFSDDAGETWKSSSKPAELSDGRGMAEPCVAEVEGGRLLMLARTGSGCNYTSWSEDGGDTWSTPEPTTLIAAADLWRDRWRSLSSTATQLDSGLSRADAAVTIYRDLTQSRPPR
jgi:hypothetical protein